MSLRPTAGVLFTLTVLIAIAGTWQANALLGSLWCLPAALLLLGLAYESAVLARARLALRIVPPQICYLGREGLLRLEFRHQLERRLALQVAPASPVEFAQPTAVRLVGIDRGEAAALTLPVVPRALGRYVWPAVRVRVGGVLGLAWWSRELADSCEVRVNPDLLREVAGVAGIGAIGGRGAVRAGAGAGAELKQLRAYVPGDSPRMIDWKATARAQRLTSRDFSEDQHLEIFIMVDAGRASGLAAGNLDRFGHYVNAAARFAQYAASLDDWVGLIVFADRPLLELPPARGAAAVMRIRSALGSARVERMESNPLHAAVRVRALARHRSLVVLLTDMDDATVAGQLAAAVRLLMPKHLPFIAGLSSQPAQALARRTARTWLDPYRALAAQEYCIGLERKLRALRALGAPALLARPGLLDRAVFDAYARFRRLRRI